MATSTQVKNVTKRPMIEIAEDEKGHWHWQLWSSNGRPMARNTQVYLRKKDILQAIRNIVKGIAEVKHVVQSHKADDAPKKSDASKEDSVDPTTKA